MCSSGSNYEPTPVPKAVPGATSVAAGSPEDSLLNLSRVRASQRKRRGAASTVRNEGGAGGISDTTSGKKLFGE
ncbi:MAG: hypothetical protein SOR75_00805 [Synergistes jonesii]|uniref:hypothetical protein n=1 Tax=Synergistes jonesii TaxID=2754 RepID=UPI002A74FECE|nr:hypothetical protein [Synergistes jonesii]MDY2983854.1 hypothetical protein [Synergistes jonesii]